MSPPPRAICHLVELQGHDAARDSAVLELWGRPWSLRLNLGYSRIGPFSSYLHPKVLVLGETVQDGNWAGRRGKEVSDAPSCLSLSCKIAPEV